ncbi:SAM-dependent methyltransferase [Candidatus Roizmanbacteria bacterium RIFCSPHIGHO2_02_FULL_39_9]|uniref:SAM-dependent methyltransferase n=1 Tax=Candidatus Roizmanbacteria bacterium RIFCSPHIGHO2_02_FULL_39_9 TaxID=1802040 RepID=A0A1F7H6I2_9BACT|nr:MAG: SAM-dependent methyltransferase [Candidatus Roizmanbacteria bacterium RIFCSPHIGHO2_02_FULL_39_9]
MTQNIYDNNDFFDKYSNLDRQTRGLVGAPEWSSIKKLLPNLKGKRVIDLGCGFGWFSRFAVNQGAKSALGIDISKNMIAKAKDFSSNRVVTYKVADLEKLQLSKGSFDFAYSSLTFHYIKNFKKLIHTIYQGLTSRSMLVFTMEHPIYTAPSIQKFTTNKDGKRIYPLNNYQIEGERISNWLVSGVIKQHKKMDTILNTLIDTGFRILHIEEWKPSNEQLKQNPEWSEEMDRPLFLIISVQKEA